MCSVSSVIEKKTAPTSRILITAPMKAHQVHFLYPDFSSFVISIIIKTCEKS